MENILMGGIENLYQMKEHIQELDECKLKEDELSLEKKNQEKKIKSLEKEIFDKKVSLIKRRKKEIEDIYEEQVDKVKLKNKKIKDKRQKNKDKKVSARIKNDTAPLTQEINDIKISIRNLFKLERMPLILNKRLFFALYMPKGLGDLGIIVGTILFAFILVPASAYYIGFPKADPKYLIGIYFVTVLVFGGLYLAIGHVFKNKHKSILIEVQELQKEKKKIKKEIKIIKKAIRIDKDESGYELKDFDENLDKLQIEEAGLMEEMKLALLNFEKETRKVIEADIDEQYSEEITGVQIYLGKIRDELQVVETRIKDITLELATKYEPYMGKEILNIENVNALITIMEQGKSENISQAIQLFKEEPQKPIEDIEAAGNES